MFVRCSPYIWKRHKSSNAWLLFLSPIFILCSRGIWTCWRCIEDCPEGVWGWSRYEGCDFLCRCGMSSKVGSSCSSSDNRGSRTFLKVWIRMICRWGRSCLLLVKFLDTNFHAPSRRSRWVGMLSSNFHAFLFFPCSFSFSWTIPGPWISFIWGSPP